MRKALVIILFIFYLIPLTGYAQIPLVEPIKILLVPGHDDEAWGAQYGNIKEADMNLVLSKEIASLLKKDKRFEVYITRDSSGYTKEFTDYFTNQKENILLFKEDSKKVALNKVSTGNFVLKTGVSHSAASSMMSLRLYGINKWANDNKIDAVIHVHVNDYPRKTKWTIGKYTGFVIYLPDSQRVNSKESVRLAKDIFTQLSKKYNTSTYKKELGGLVFDQTLIALGSSGTLSETTRSILVEYCYIYQKMFRNSTTRHKAYKDMAGLTVKGITNYFYPLNKE